MCKDIWRDSHGKAMGHPHEQSTPPWLAGKRTEISDLKELNSFTNNIHLQKDPERQAGW